MIHRTVTTIAALLGLLTISLFGPSAQADTPKPQVQTLRVYSMSDIPQGKCPKEVKVTIQPSPYREGGYSSSGKAQLQPIAEAVEFEGSDRFSVTWRARLKPQYRSCIGTAGLVRSDDAPMSNLLVRMRFVNGNAYFIVDSTGIPDANDYTTVILQQKIEGGNPSWRWGGTD
jgi:hypothetical protein